MTLFTLRDSRKPCSYEKKLFCSFATSYVEGSRSHCFKNLMLLRVWEICFPQRIDYSTPVTLLILCDFRKPCFYENTFLVSLQLVMLRIQGPRSPNTWCWYDCERSVFPQWISYSTPLDTSYTLWFQKAMFVPITHLFCILEIGYVEGSRRQESKH